MENYKLTKSRQLLAVQLREEGKTFAQIAEILNCSRQNAFMLVKTNKGRTKKRTGLHDLRRSKEIKQVDMADMLHISRSDYWRKEAGHKPFEDAEFERMEEILETPQETLRNLLTKEL